MRFVKSRNSASACEDFRPEARDYSGVFDEVPNGITSHIRAAVDVSFEPVAIRSSENAIDNNRSAVGTEAALSHDFDDEDSDNLTARIVDASREEEMVIIGEDCEVRSQGDTCPV